ncbi:acetate uptake transporter [Viridibacillus arvi]|uniref:acetate uptake transporter n=1 Tax=Viridibacillus arvi TaxID=263475 RepID=UPI003697F9BF
MNQTKDIKITTADPSGIGLFGLAIVTLVASSQKLGWTEGVGLVIPWAIFLGGIAQFYASILDSKHNNTFGTTAFGAYGLFWMAVATSWFVQSGTFGLTLQESADVHQLGFVYIGYLVFTIFMTIGALETNKVLFFIFFLINFLFVGLSLSSLGIMEHGMHLLAAYSEFGIAILSLYGAGANVLNKHFGFEFLPLGKPFGIITKPLEKEKTAHLQTNNQSF